MCGIEMHQGYVLGGYLPQEWMVIDVSIGRKKYNKRKRGEEKRRGRKNTQGQNHPNYT